MYMNPGNGAGLTFGSFITTCLFHQCYGVQGDIWMGHEGGKYVKFGLG